MENDEPLNGMGDVYHLAFTPDSKYLLSASYSGARLWNVHTGALVHRFWDGEYNRSAALSPDGRYVLTSSEEKGVWLWDSQTGRFLQRFTPGTDISPVLTSYASPFSPDGQRVMIGGYDGLHIWDIKARKDAQVFGHRSSAGMYSPDGKYALGYSVLGLQVWDTQTGQVLHEFGKQEAAGEFSPNSELLLTIEGGTFYPEQIFRLYEVPSWKELRHLAGSFTLTSVRAFSPDSRYLIIGYLGSHAEIWSVDSGTLVHDLK
jgi:WD40 repeat protein